MTVGPKHRKRSWCMLVAVVVAIVVLIGFGIYTTSRTAKTQEGSQGPLAPNAATSDPASLVMNPQKTR